MTLQELSRADMLALTPETYLRHGFRDQSDAIRPELLTQAALAAALQLFEAGLAPQEFAMTVAALRQILPLHADGAAPARITAALDETFAVVGRMIRQQNNEGLVSWLRACAKAVRQPADIESWQMHVEAALRQYTALASLPPPSSLPDSSGPVQP